MRLKRMYPTENIVSWGDITKWAIGPNFGNVVNVLLITMQLGICTVYFRFMPTNLHATMKSVPEYDWLRGTAPFMIVLCWIRHMKHLAPFSTFANIATLITVMTVIGFAVSTIYDVGHTADVQMTNWAGLPVFFGIMIYSFEGSGAILSIHESMAEPSEFVGVVRQAGLVVLACFFMTGLICYIAFGDINNGSITAELGHRTQNHVLNFLNLLIAVAVGLTYPLQAYAAIEVLERKLKIVPKEVGASAVGTKENTDLGLKGMLGGVRVKQYVFRSLLVLTTAFIAGSVENLGLIVGLFGSVNGSIIALVLPPVLDLSSNTALTQRERFLNWFTAAFGTIGGVAGTIMSINEIIAESKLPPGEHLASAHG